MNEAKREERIHEVFEISILLKGVNALVQLALGFSLLVAPQFVSLLIALVQNELVEDPGDFFARNVQGWLQPVSDASLTFAALYLLSHGIVKLWLVWGLWRDKLWAYPASLAVLSLFILYQVVRWAETRSLALLLLTLFDLLVIALIWHEWRQRYHHHRRNELR